MSLITRTYSFTDGTTAYGSQVDAEIANIVNTINSLDSAGTSWTNVKVTTLTPLANINMGGYKITNLANGTASGQAVNYDQLSALSTAVTGSLLMYPVKTAPTGYLYCNGAAVSRGTYATLFGIVGTTFGQGDGSTTFNLPDYRGKFIRGVDDGAGNDPDAASRTHQTTGGNTGDKAGTCQTAQQSKAHTHPIPHQHDTTTCITNGGATLIVDNTNPYGTTSYSHNYSQVGTAAISANSQPYQKTSDTLTANSSTNNSYTDGLEVRPINTSIYFHIKI